MMTKETMRDLFEKHEDEHLEFEKIKQPKSKRPDLHAFLLLDELCPGDTDIVIRSAADSYYEFGLNIDITMFSAKITEEHIIELTRCGVMYDETRDVLTMFF